MDRVEQGLHAHSYLHCPIYIVHEVGSRMKHRTLHRNLLLPFKGLPSLEHSKSSSGQPSGQELQYDEPISSLVEITPAALVLLTSGDSELDSVMDAQNKK